MSEEPSEKGILEMLLMGGAVLAITSSLLCSRKQPLQKVRPASTTTSSVPFSSTMPKAVLLEPSRQAYDLECYVVLKPDGFYQRNNAKGMINRVKDFYQEHGVRLDFQLCSIDDVPTNRDKHTQFLLQELDDAELYQKIVRPQEERLRKEYRRIERNMKLLVEQNYLRGILQKSYDSLLARQEQELFDISERLQSLQEFYLHSLRTFEGVAIPSQGMIFLLHPRGLRVMNNEVRHLLDARVPLLAEKEGSRIIAHEVGHLMGLRHTFNNPLVSDFFHGVPNMMSYQPLKITEKFGFAIAPSQAGQLLQYVRTYCLQQ